MKKKLILLCVIFILFNIAWQAWGPWEPDYGMAIRRSWAQIVAIFMTAVMFIRDRKREYDPRSEHVHCYESKGERPDAKGDENLGTNPPSDNPEYPIKTKYDDTVRRQKGDAFHS